MVGSRVSKGVDYDHESMGYEQLERRMSYVFGIVFLVILEAYPHGVGEDVPPGLH